MKQDILSFLIVIVIIGLFNGCKPTESFDFTDSNVPAPASISNITITEIPGGAILHYKLPKDPNLLYIKAEYEIQPGVFSEVKASIYIDTLTLAGFGDVLEHEVKLYSVGKNKKVSDPISVIFRPLTPPILSVFETLNFNPTFGGVNMSFTNDSRANLSFSVLVDSTGNNEWSSVTTFYSASLLGNFSARGLDPEEKRFAIVVKDRWGNKSDTLIKVMTPFYEEFISKKDMKAIALPTDAPVLSGTSLEKLFDNIINNDANIYASTNTAGIPQWFTLDFGSKVSINRFKVFQRGGPARVYIHNVPKRFELYGSNSPDSDGGWDNWELLGEFETYKPSGLPYGQVSPEDIQYAGIDGDDFTFENPAPAIRYIRFKTTETYGMSDQVVLSELSFWGKTEK